MRGTAARSLGGAGFGSSINRQAGRVYLSAARRARMPLGWESGNGGQGTSTQDAPARAGIAGARDCKRRGAGGASGRGRAGGAAAEGGAGGQNREQPRGGNGFGSGRGGWKNRAFVPLAKIPQISASRRRAPFAAILILSAAFLSGCCAAPPHAHADGHQLAVEISSGAASPTNLTSVPFTVKFSGTVNASTLDAADISVSSGTVQNLRLAPQHNATLGGGSSDDGQFKYPVGVAVGGSGRIYVADTFNHRVQVFDPDGTHNVTFGGEGSGDGQFKSPVGVAVDGSGRVYVADGGNDRVQVFDPDGTHNATIGEEGSGDGQFKSPVGVAVDGSGRVYVADGGNDRVQVFDPDGTHNATIGEEGSGDGQFDLPYGVAVGGSGRIYVADVGNSRVQVFDPDGTHNVTFGEEGSGDGQFRSPNGVAVDGPGRVYVTDIDNDRVQVFNPDGTHNATIGEEGSGDGQFDMPYGVAVGGPGRVYVADTWNHRVQVFDPDGTHNGTIGDENAGGGRFSHPRGVAVDGPGRVYVADAGNSRVQVINPNWTYSATFGGEGSGDGQFKYPVGVAVDGSGRIYVADAFNHRVQVFDPDGTHNVTFGGEGSGDGQFRNPGSVAVDGSGRIYVADSGNDRVHVFDPDGTHNATIGGEGSGDGQFRNPGSVAVDGSGRIYVADAGNSRVQVFDPDGTHNVTFGGEGSGDGRFSNPAGVAVDGSGRIYVADAFNHRVQVFDPDGTHGATIGEDGSGDGQFRAPHGVAVDGSGRIYVADTENNRVQVFDAAYAFDVADPADGQTLAVNMTAGRVLDRAGNANEASGTARIGIDRTRPAPTVAAAHDSPTDAATIEFTVDFGENVTGFEAGDVVLSGSASHGGAANFSGGNATYAFGVTPTSDGTILVDIPANAARDAAGNGNQPAARFSITREASSALLLESAALDLTAGANGRLTLTFDGAAAAPDVWSFEGEITVRGDGGAVALSAGDVPSIASGRTGGRAFALDVSGAKRVQLNGADLGSAAVSLPGGFVSDMDGRPYAGNQPAVPLAYVQDPSPPRLVAASFNLAPAGGGGRLTLTFDEAAAVPDMRSFPGGIEVRGSGGAGKAATVVLSAGDVVSAESGRAGDMTFGLLVSDQKRAALGAQEYADPLRTTVALPAGFASNGRSGYEREHAPLAVAPDAGAPSFARAFVMNGSSVTVVYDEPVLTVPAHYSNITVGGTVVEGNRGAASGAAAFGRNVVVSWNAGAGAAASASPAVEFDLSGGVTDQFGNPLANPGPKTADAPGGRPDGKQHVRIGAFASGPGDPSAEAARLGAAAFNALSAERGYPFYVSVSKYNAPAGASGAGAEAALRGAHDGGQGPVLYVGPASDAALHGMAGYAAANGITMVSHSSAARSLAAGGDGVYRLEPGAAHLAKALAHGIARGGFDAVVPVVQSDLYGGASAPGSGLLAYLEQAQEGQPGASGSPDRSYGLLGPLASDLAPLGIPVGRPVEFRGGGGAGSVGAIEAAVMAAAGSGTGRNVAVVYAGSGSELAAIAGNVSAGSPVRDRSAWFAAGGAGAGTGDGVAASPLVISDAAAVRLARDVRLSAVQFAVERNGMTDYIDGAAGVRGPAGSATPAYAAYEAARMLGRALASAGGDPSEVRGHAARAAALDGGPLGRTGVDRNGDLRLPVTYGVWSVSHTAAG